MQSVSDDVRKKNFLKSHVLSWRWQWKVHSDREDLTSLGRAFPGLWASDREKTNVKSFAVNRYFNEIT